MSSKPRSQLKKAKKGTESVPARSDVTKSKKLAFEESPDLSDKGEESLEEAGGSDSEDDGGVDEEGMEKLLKALGDDGLDDYSRAALRGLESEESEYAADEGEDGEEEEEEEAVDEQYSSEEDDGEEEDAKVDEPQEVANESEEEGEEDIALDEVGSVDEDAVLTQKVEIDNKIALERIRETIKLDSSLPWTEILVVSYPETFDVDVEDDLNRELAIYKQALHGAQLAKTLAAKHNLPFTRPPDYFAEMVKSDAHMERIRQRLLDEGASIKRSEDKRKEREGKKFGKQVQMEKLKDRERSKKDMEERLKGLKRKRKGALDNAQEGDDAFDVAVEDAISDRPNKRSRGGADGKRQISRQSRDQKFGYGGPGRRAKQNTKDSTDSFVTRGGKASRGAGRGGARGGAREGARGGRGGARGGAKRPGRGRRMTTRGRS